MATEHDNNRSSALSPEALAVINSTTAAAVKEAMAAALGMLAPIIEKIAITPEKLREANRPYEDPKKILREARESAKSKLDEQEIAKATAARQAACTHMYTNGTSSVNLCHNMPDRQPRGVCVTCGAWIHPREWRIGAPTEEYPRGKAYIVDAHRDYRIVQNLEARS
jgi:hypothetical protein